MSGGKVLSLEKVKQGVYCWTKKVTGTNWCQITEEKGQGGKFDPNVEISFDFIQLWLGIIHKRLPGDYT